MRKSNSTPKKETPEQELESLRKENAELKDKLEARDAIINHLQKENKKKDVPTITVTEEQRKQLLTLFPDIDFLFR